MAVVDINVKPPERALLRNVIEFYKLVVEVRDRPREVPHNIGVCHGFSGVGKTEACIYAMNKTGGRRVEIDVDWSKKSFFESILLEIGIAPPRLATIATLSQMVKEALTEDLRKPLFIDEADIAFQKGWGDSIRAMAMKSGAPIILIGEEMLPAEIAKIDRFENRVLKWFPALPCDLDDVKTLARSYVGDLSIPDSVLNRLNVREEGCTRRIVTSLVNLKQHVLQNGGVKAIPPDFDIALICNPRRPKARSMSDIKKTLGRVA